MKPEPHETILIGKWISDSSGVHADDIAKRIQLLTQEYFQEIAVNDQGWTILYWSQEDGNYWELSYPHSELHGGGPPMLERITEEQARSKYNIKIK